MSTSSSQNKKVIRLLLFRHGESASNVEPDIIGGRQNSIPLTKKGREQAANLGKYLKGKGVVFTRVFSSTAVRAKQTAKICLEEMRHKTKQCNVVESDRLLEQDMGDWTGKKKKEVYTPAAWKAFRENPWELRPPNGESQKDTEERMSKFVEEEILQLLDEASCDGNVINVAIFGHALAFRCLLRFIMNFPPSDTLSVRIDNCSITELVITEDNKMHVVGINDNAHLKKAKIL